LFNIFYSIILVPSALWMPLTFLAVEQASPGLLWLVRIDLWVVATASLSLLLALLNVEPRQPRWAHRLAIVGSLGFCLQTVVFDALVWVTFFHL
jgi:Na+-translocating ferredoxin:NAD+ oxidoreductase RnfA subunit